MVPRVPDSLTVHVYNVGFGDCFLLSFKYGGDARHVLIDFGTTSIPRTRPGLDPMHEIASDIRRRCGGKLHAVVATHRHRDHISGFAGKPGEIITELSPDVVVQPWTEDPDLAPDATGPLRRDADLRSFVASLHNMQLVAQQVQEGLAGGIASGEGIRRQLAFLSEDNIPNHEAVASLRRMGRTHRYVSYGAQDPLASVLPGVRTRVLGPPTLAQSQVIRRQRSRDDNEFWHFQALATSAGPNGRRPVFGDAAVYRPGAIPPDAQWFLERLQAARGDQLLAIVRALDAAINNTSVILLIRAGSRKLLFPGDAQVENWAYALSRDAHRLRDVDVYKVGHHGSLNATPKTLWQLFGKRAPKRAARRLTTLLSTLPEKHGDPLRGTEVPRRKLVDELGRQTNLLSTLGVQPGACLTLSMNLRR